MYFTIWDINYNEFKTYIELEYLKFDRALLAYLKDSGVHRIFNYGCNDDFDYVPRRIDGKEVHLLFPHTYYPRIPAEITRRKAGFGDSNGFEDLKPGEYWKYEYEIGSDYIEMFMLEYPDREYYLVIVEPVNEFLDYPESYKTWNSLYKSMHNNLGEEL